MEEKVLFTVLTGSISYEDFLQVVQFLLFVGVLANLVGSVAHALHHTCEHPRVIITTQEHKAWYKTEHVHATAIILHSC